MRRVTGTKYELMLTLETRRSPLLTRKRRNRPGRTPRLSPYEPVGEDSAEYRAHPDLAVERDEPTQSSLLSSANASTLTATHAARNSVNGWMNDACPVVAIGVYQSPRSSPRGDDREERCDVEEE